MASRQLLLTGGLIRIIATVLSTSKTLYDSSRNNEKTYGSLLLDLNISYYLYHYDIELTVMNFENTTVSYFNFFGKCKIHINFTKTDVLNLYVGTTIEILNNNVVPQDQPARNIPHVLSQANASYASFICLDFDPHVLEGTYILTLEFNGIAYDNEIGLFRTSYLQENDK